MLSLLARSSSAVAIPTAARRAFSVSAMKSADDKTPTAGATASSKGFSKREKAEEDRYILERERERYKRAHAALEQQKKDLEQLEKDHANAEKK
ncbi:hypothetical protein P389DRAFT_172522 [Cystobasidium minutum MCA 4210]|uniref:uncharacterized protein n=1 Tax=Cystobasidium minutum MCA 4210 TaxID=1397322 RepID=UPI0034CEBB97|eukprot:jgi/Rhomi1/172522/fgenesh1_kg.5_\